MQFLYEVCYPVVGESLALDDRILGLGSSILAIFYTQLYDFKLFDFILKLQDLLFEIKNKMYSNKNEYLSCIIKVFPQNFQPVCVKLNKKE